MQEESAGIASFRQAHDDRVNGPVKIIACIEDPVMIEKILNHLKAREANKSPQSIQLPPPRAPPLLPGWEQGLAD